MPCGSVNDDCVRTVSHTPRNPGGTPSFTGTRRRTSMLREVVDRKCVRGIWCASARVSGINFQACSIDHSDISPFRINDLRTIRNSVAQNSPSNRIVPRCCLYSGVCGRAEIRLRGNCVRPLNVRRSLRGNGRHAPCRRPLGLREVYAAVRKFQPPSTAPAEHPLPAQGRYRQLRGWLD